MARRPPHHRPSDKPGERLSGPIERVTFHSEESGFCVLKIKVPGHRELVSVVGSAASVSPGEHIEGEGQWVNDRTHGLQFKAHSLRVIPPSTLEGMEKYLASGMIQGIGPHFAKKLVHAFKEEVFEVIEEHPERLLELPGIGEKRKEQLTRAWTEQKAVREIMVFLQSHGLGTARAVRIYKTYGEGSISQVTDNPYRLALDITGIGFMTADTLAQRLGVPQDSPQRAQAGVRHVLQELASQGHCAAGRDTLTEASRELLHIPVDVIEQAIEVETTEENMIAQEVDGVPCLFLAPLYHAEVGVVQSMLRLMDGKTVWTLSDPEAAIPWVEKKTGLKLSQSQGQAVVTALVSKVTIITGGPGVGKTTLVNSILKIILAKRAKVLLCAPTGRAAKRLSESAGLEAKTIHRLLEFDPKMWGFRRTRSNPLDADLVVIDEASMVDVVLMNQLLKAIPSHAALMIVGDVDQLPSVGPGAVLADLITSGQIPTVRLTEIFRQAASSKIIVNAHRINQGQMPLNQEDSEVTTDFYFIAAQTPEEIADKLFLVLMERIPKRFGFQPVRDIQVLTPMNRAGLGTQALNLELQKRLNPKSEPRITRFGWTYAPGDKVIQMRNNYEKEVFNGDIGTIFEVDIDEGLAIINFEGRKVEYEFGELDEISLAYATTIHKSQGSEFPAVVIPLATQHYSLLERKLLYTAVSRGKELVVIIGQPKALSMAVKNVRSSRRLTALAQRLVEGKGKE